MLIEIIMYKIKEIEVFEGNYSGWDENKETKEMKEYVWKQDIKECERVLILENKIVFPQRIMEDIDFELYGEYLTRIEVLVNGFEKLNKIFEKKLQE